VIGLNIKVSDLVDDTISYVTVVVEQISEKYGVEHKKFCVIPYESFWDVRWKIDGRDLI
jgi:hypothetical protein